MSIRHPEALLAKTMHGIINEQNEYSLQCRNEDGCLLLGVGVPFSWWMREITASLADTKKTRSSAVFASTTFSSSAKNATFLSMCWVLTYRERTPSIQRNIVLASRVSGRHLDTQTLRNHPSGHPKFWGNNLVKCHFQT